MNQHWLLPLIHGSFTFLMHWKTWRRWKKLLTTDASTGYGGVLLVLPKQFAHRNERTRFLFVSSLKILLVDCALQPAARHSGCCNRRGYTTSIRGLPSVIGRQSYLYALHTYYPNMLLYFNLCEGRCILIIMSRSKKHECIKVWKSNYRL